MSGNRARIRDLKDMIDRGNVLRHFNLTFSGAYSGDLKTESPHTLCCLFKSFLRDLPESLCTQARIEDFTDIVDIYDGTRDRFELNSFRKR